MDEDGGRLAQAIVYGLVYLAGMAHAFDRRCTHDDGMAEQQLDLFAHRGGAIERGLSRSTHHALLATEIDDESLIAAIAESTLAEGCKLVAEAGRRRLAAAVPALAALCRSFTAFGTRRMIPEQTAAIEALAIIGGREAAHAVLEMIERAVVQGPGLQLAVSAAAPRLGSIAGCVVPAVATRRAAHPG